jgi:hypothetical protein
MVPTEPFLLAISFLLFTSTSYFLLPFSKFSLTFDLILRHSAAWILKSIVESSVATVNLEDSELAIRFLAVTAQFAGGLLPGSSHFFIRSHTFLSELTDRLVVADECYQAALTVRDFFHPLHFFLLTSSYY